MASVSALSQDILYKIFLQLYRERSALSQDDPWVDFPWNIASVCTQWRKVAISAPRLWTRIETGNHECIFELEMNSGACVSATGALHVVRTHLQLQRSTDQVLTVDASLFEEAGRTCQCDWSILLAASIHCSRWETAELSTNLAMRKLISMLPHSEPKFTQLQALSCEFPDDGTSMDWQLEGLERSTGFPRLTHLCLSHWSPIPSRIINSPLPWTQIACLQLQEFVGQASGLYQVLSLCCNITQLFLQCNSAEWDPAIEQSDLEDLEVLAPFALSKLTDFDLDLDYDHYSPILSAFTLISLPSLRAMCYRGVLLETALEQLAGLFERSSCPLTSLKFSALEPGMFYGPAYKDLFGKLPTLHKLTLFKSPRARSPYSCDAVLVEILRGNDAATPFLPQLRCLQLKNVWSDVALITEFVRSRNARGTTSMAVPIEEIHIGYDDDGYDDELGEHTRGVKLSEARFQVSLLRSALETCDLAHPCGVVLRKASVASEIRSSIMVIPRY